MVIANYTKGASDAGDVMHAKDTKDKQDEWSLSGLELEMGMYRMKGFALGLVSERVRFLSVTFGPIV